ncbi:amidohydrolase family protein [Streptomyces sp. SL13]|uniref:Amidohydrolase family protein n=1 Tax=Streptantibioticus silvisoli TaxID=2705255 RepID=A0AA90H1J3_9ACTN|nr:amidohydrolase family protein [Streptantibioticus silvisoli]MDI5969616.1 amidohydrolase family protein [Streptantibioticus silvisoli]
MPTSPRTSPSAGRTPSGPPSKACGCCTGPGSRCRPAPTPTTPGASRSAPRHGESLHHELELLVRAGLSTAEALRAAAALPARHFRLPDRGAVAPGPRADLVLVDGDPIADIRATRAIRRNAGTPPAPGGVR